MITQGEILDITQQGFITVLMTAAPILLTSLIVGLAISIFQTVTSIQEQTLTFVPKIVIAFITLMLLGSWMMDNLSGFLSDLWNNFAYYLN